jgi:hypothetical protein
MINPIYGLSPVLIHKGTNVNYTAEYKAVLAAITGTQPSSSIKAAQNAFVKTLVDGGIWAKFVHIIPYAWGMPDAVDALLWINAPATKATLSTTAPTYIAGKGFTGDGSSSYIKTGFNPTANGGTKFTQNNASYGWYYANNKEVGKTIDGIDDGAQSILMAPNLNAFNAYFALNGNYGLSPLYSSNYLLCLTRNSSANFNFHVNKEEKIVKTIASAPIANRELYTLADNKPGVTSDFGTNTIGLEFGASYLDQSEINLLNDAWAELLQAIRPAILFSDACDGSVIDTDKWTVTNPNPLAVAFSQNNGIAMDLLAGSSSTIYTNIIKSKVSASFGVWKFSMLDIASYSQVDNSKQIGLLTNSTKDGVYFSRDVANGVKFSLYVKQNNGATLKIQTDIYDFAQIKIIITPLHEISVYKWSNDQWVQMGTTINYAIGELNFFMSGLGLTGTQTVIRDVVISNRDFTTLNP